MKTIPLTKGYFTQVDDEDYKKFASVRWYAAVGKYGIRAVRDQWKNGKKKQLQLSREILNAPKNKYVDHIDGDTLNNQRSNLRIATNSQNQMNQGIRKNNTSGFKGVTWDKSKRKWKAQITIYGKVKFLGNFFDPIDAAKTYDKTAKKHFREFARLNNQVRKFAENMQD